MAKEKEEVKADLSKAETIAKTKKELDKKWGKGIVIGAKDKPLDYPSLSTGSIGLDDALGIGGLPKGRVIEVFGPESSGKTTLCLEVIAQAHRENKDSHCLVIDAEHAMDTFYAQNLGVDLDRLEICQPDFGEQGLDVAEVMIGTGAYDVVVIDSVAALVPKSEIDKEMGDPTMGSHARLMSQALRKLTPIVAKTGCILIFINQLREKIGVMFGNPETTTGGNALKFYASVRLDIRRQISDKKGGINDENDQRIGNQVTIKVIKNKMAPPFRKCQYDVYYGEGIDKLGEIFAHGVSTNVIEKAGSHFSYNGTALGQGKEKVMVTLRDNPELAEEIRGKVIISLKTVTTVTEEIEENDSTTV